MRTRSLDWRRAALFACFSMFAACSDSSPAQPQGCNPTCSAGYTCVQSLCTALCNPACAPGQMCTVVAGNTQCVAAQGDAGMDDIADVPVDNAQPPDVAGDSAGDDVAADTVTPPPDAPPPGDGGATDASMDAYVPPACGAVGQVCCGADPMVAGSGVCTGNATCSRTSRRCEAFTPEPTECTATVSCPAGQVCGFGELCGMGTRSCLRCIPAPTMGALPGGAACNGTMPCADGVCVNGQCTRACVIGPSGDAQCNSYRAGTFCGEVRRAATVDGPTTVFGACVTSCLRDRDCTLPGQRCRMALGVVQDTVYLSCRGGFGTLEAGAACPLMPQRVDGGNDPGMYCANDQCFSTTASMTMGYCASFCATNADCPGPTYACVAQGFFRPSGPTSPTVPVRMCVRM